MKPRPAALWLAFVLALAVPFVLESWFVFQAATALTYAVALSGLVVITGYGGQLALGNGAFFAIGAYTTAVLMQRTGLPFVSTLPLAAGLAFASGVIIGLPALRLRGHFLALLTLAIAVAAPQFIKHFESVSGGVRGLSIVAADPPPWLGLDASQRNYLVCLAVTTLAFAATHLLVRGRIGRALLAIRDNETVAAAMGIDVARYKVLAFAYSAVLAGLGGSLYAYVVGYISPDGFTIGFAALLIIGLVVGGKSSLAGAAVGALFIVLVPVYAAKIDPALSGLSFAAVVVLVLILAPDGLVSLAARLTQRLRGPAPPPSS